MRKPLLRLLVLGALLVLVCTAVTAGTIASQDVFLGIAEPQTSVRYEIDNLSLGTFDATQSLGQSFWLRSN